MSAANFRRKKCIVSSCLRSTDDGVKLHRCGVTFKEIGKVLGKNNLTKNTYICSLHFDPSCFSRKGGLNPNAIPTLGLSTGSSVIKRCIVPHCSNTDAGSPMFKARSSFALVGTEIGADLTKGWICGAHFEEECIDSKGRLRQGVLPTLGFVTEESDGTLTQVTIRTVQPESTQDDTVDLILSSDDVVSQIVDDCGDVEVRAENNKLRLQLKRSQEEMMSLRNTIKLLQEDLAAKNRKIEALKSDLRIANSASRHVEVRIVKE